MTALPWRALLADPRVRWGALTLAAVLAACIAGPLLGLADPAAQPDPVGLRELPPSWTHPLGTDGVSRDVLSRLLHGGRTSLGIAAGAVVLATLLGGAWGIAAAFAPPAVEAVMMRVVDTMAAVPRLLLGIVLVATLGTLPPAGLALLLGGTGWLGTARLVRAEARALRARPHILAARALGCTDWLVVRRHILPPLVPLLAVTATLTLAATVPLEAGLSFLGLGVRPPAPSWGTILLEGAERPATLWWLVLAPAAAIAVTVAAANAVGEGLRDVLGAGPGAPR